MKVFVAANCIGVYKYEMQILTTLAFSEYYSCVFWLIVRLILVLKGGGT